MTSSKQTLGFIGLGVMGEPMCRNLAAKSGADVVGLDRVADPMTRLAAAGVRAGRDVGDVVRDASVVFLSLPSGEAVASLARAEDGLLAHVRPGQIVVDLSTSPVELTRTLADEFAQRGATLAQIAMSYVLAQSFPVFPLVGCANGAEYAANAAAFDVALTTAEIAWLEQGE